MSRGPNQPNPLEEWLSRAGDKQSALIGGGVAVAAIILLWGALTSYYTVQPDGQAVVKRFGRVIDIKPPGPHFKLPFGIDRQQFVPTRRVLKQEFGFRSVGPRDSREQYRKRPEHQDESLMLTGDLKVVDVEWVVQYRIEDPNRWLHRVVDNDKTIRDTSEAVMRRIVGNSLGSDVLTVKRVQIASLAKQELQEILDSFEMGVRIGTIELQDVTPPDPVKPAFNEVNTAEQEKERMINEAEKRQNQSVPRARGEARQLVEEAEGYRAQRINRASGDAARFTAIAEQYNKSPEVTRRRLYLEMIDDVLPAVGRVVVIEPGQTGPLPLLNLDGPLASDPPASAPAPSRGQSSSGRR